MKFITSLIHISVILILLIFLPGCRDEAVQYTRGIGIYPGNPAEDFSPQLVPDNENYRNIARLRAAYHSSSYDYNLTAQLVTDGIITDRRPTFISVSTNNGILPKNEREWLFDHNSVTVYDIRGENVWFQVEQSEATDLPEVSKIVLNGNMNYSDSKPGGWQFTCLGSDDGIRWKEIGRARGSGLPGMERPGRFPGRTGNRQQQQVRPGAPGQQNRPAGARGQQPVAPVMPGMQASPPGAPQPSFRFNFGMPRPQRIINQSFEFEKPLSYRFYKVVMTARCAESWSFGDLDFYSGNIRLKITPSGSFNSSWMSSGTGQEWVYVDLGSESEFDNIRLHWIRKAVNGSLQVSDDSKKWSDVASLPGNSDTVDDIKLNEPANGRYVRLLMNGSADGDRYILSEMEIFGKGGLIPVPESVRGISGNRFYLTGGNWKIQRSSEVMADGKDISQPDFSDGEWIPATVPGTALVSYWNEGALPDPNYGDNQLMISESFFNSDFWYRNEFELPSDFKGEHIFLNFDGINWKADVYVNGNRAGRINGGFIRGRFDITELVMPGEKNSIAVLIIKNQNIGIIKEKTVINTDKNGGVLGADNPTYHASIGWDWIPTIRGRNIGIWNDVYLSSTGSVTINNPFIITDLNLPDTTTVDINVEVELQNHEKKEVSGVLSGKYGNIRFDLKVALNALETKVVRLNPATHTSLKLKNPELWWPKGYGKPYLYDVELIFNTGNQVSDWTTFKSGIREMSFSEENRILNLYINGRRFIGHGGNWGFPESNLKYRNREYDIAVAYHADMNFTMIRNWVGQTGDNEFYEVCDRYGVMVWQDFWLANPVDGPDPDDPGMFMNNAEDLLKRIRNHPSIALYCGRNEGNPPPVIDTALRKMIPKIHPGIHYISNSSMGVVSGGGPYRALPVKDYFLLYGFNKFHSERGMPNVMTWESLNQMLPQSAMWPQNNQWGMHDYTLSGAQAAASFNQMIEKAFGRPDNAKKFTELAQWINYNGYRGMFEGRSQFRQGLLLWMSHSCWPSMVWQTYDYYFDPTAAYFGCKKACEPIHIQWNPVYDEIETVNLHAWDRSELTAFARLYNMDGSLQWEKDTIINAPEDATVRCFKLKFPSSLSSVHFIRLTLKEKNKIISENFYWRGTEDGNYQALNDLPVVILEASTKARRSGNTWRLETRLRNSSGTPALMVRLKVKGKESGERILPVFFSDNFISLLPGEEKIITMSLHEQDTRGETPEIEISGFNLSD